MATVTTLIVIACVNAIGLYCSCLFRRSIHAIPVCYAIVIALIVITFVGGMISESSHREVDSFRHLKPWLYSNPFFFLVLAFAPRAELFPDWFVSAGIFSLIAVAAGVLALLQLRRTGEQV